MSDRYMANLTPEGRILIPAAMRRQLGLEPGATVSLRVEDGDIVITSPEAALRRAKERFRGVERSLAQELIDERRAEAAADAVASPRPAPKRR